MLDPSQQLAHASGQFQSSVTIPGQYGPGAYPAFSERAGTMATQAITQGAIMGTGLATSTLLSFAPSFLDDNSSLLKKAAYMDPGTWSRGGERLGKALTFGSRAGGTVGKLSAGAASFALPMVLGEAYMAAGRRMVEGQREFLATRSLMRDLPYSGQFGAGSVLGGGGSLHGSAQSSMQVAQFQSNIANMGASYGASSGQMRNLVGAMGQQGMLDTSSVSNVSSSIQKSLAELKKVAQIINTDLDGAMKTYGELKQMGFSSSGSRLGALRQMSGASAMSGMSLGQVSQIGGMGAQMGLQMGLSPDMGFQTGMSSIANAAYRESAGAVNPLYMQRIGGVAGHAARMTELQMGAVSSEGGQAMMSRMFDGASGAFDTGAFSAQMGRDRLRASRSFFKEADPYQLSNMRREFSEMAPGLIMAQVSGIQARNSGDQAQANRRQYELLSQYGISDPDEQLEFLGSLRTQGRANALAMGQQASNATLLSQGGRDVPTISEHLGQALRDLTRKVIGSGEEFERYGANLQSRLERQIQSATESIIGTPRSFRAGDYSSNSLAITRAALMSGDMEGQRISDPFGSFQSFLERSPSARRMLGQSSSITGVTDLSENGMFSGTINGLVSMAGRVGYNGHSSFANDFGSMTGMTGTAANGIFAGRLGGSDQYMTPSEFVEGVALQFGQVLNPETGMFVGSNQSNVDTNLYGHARSLAGVERRILDEIRPPDTGVLQHLTWSMGYSSDNELGDTRNVQLSDVELAELTSGENRAGHINSFAQALYGKDTADLTPREFRDTLDTLRQAPGQIGQALAGEESDVNPWTAVASTYATLASQNFDSMVGGSDARSERDALLGNTVKPAELWRGASRIGFRYSDYMRDNGFTDQRGMYTPMDMGALHDSLLADGQVGMADSIERRMRRAQEAGRTDSWVATDRGSAGSRGLDGMNLNLGEDATDALRGMYDGAGRSTVTGALAGVNARAGGTTLEEIVSEYASGGGGYRSDEEAMAAIQSFIYSGAGSTAGDVTSAVAAIRSTPAGEAGSAALDRVLAATVSGGNLVQSPVDTITLDEIHDRLAGRPERREQMDDLLSDQRALDRATSLASGIDVAQRRSGESLGSIRRGYLEELGRSGVRDTFIVGDETYSAGDFLDLVQDGGVSIEEANGIFNGLTPEEIETALEAAVATGDTDRADTLTNILRMRQGSSTGEGASDYDVLSGLISSTLSDGQLTAEDIGLFASLPALQENMSLIEQIQSTGTSRSEDRALLEQMFGSEENLSTFLTEAGYDGDLETMSDTFSRGLESGGVHPDQMTHFMKYLSSTFVLGENERADIKQAGRDHDQAEYHRTMLDIINNGSLNVNVTGGGANDREV